MNKKMLLTLLVLCLFFISGCTEKPTCSTTYSTTQPTIKTYIVKDIDFDWIYNYMPNGLMNCYDNNGMRMNNTEQEFYFNIVKTGYYYSEIKESNTIVEETFFPDFYVDILFPKDDYSSCSITHFDLNRFITINNTTYKISKCYYGYFYEHGFDLYNLKGENFDYGGFERIIKDCISSEYYRWWN